jgi:hypothetical protein
MQVVDEPYPDSCQNSGQLASQTQQYYMCREIGEAQQLYRVTSETYQKLSNKSEFKCVKKEVTKNVCVCPKGFGDFQCATQLY